MGLYTARYLVSPVAAVLLCALTVLAFSILTASRAPIQRNGPAYATGFEACALPCWAGISVEQTPLSEVPTRLQQNLTSASTTPTVTAGSFIAFGQSGAFSGIIWPSGSGIGYISLSGLNVPAWLLLADLNYPACVQIMPPDTLVLIWEHPDATVMATFLGTGENSWNIEHTASMLYIGSTEERPCTDKLYDRLHPWQGMASPWHYSH